MLRKSSLLILIALALLLSAASNVKGDANKADKIETSGGKHDQHGEHATPTPQQSSAKESAANAGDETYNYYGSLNYSPTYTGPPESRWRIAGDVASVVSTVFVAAFTGLLVWFNWQLVGVTGEMKKATIEAAEAAKASAIIAKGSLLASARPKLVVRYVRKHICEPEKPIEIYYTVVNVGGWPAYVLESNFAISDSNSLPPMPPYKDAGVLGNAKIPSGAWKTGHYVSKEVLSRDRFGLLYNGSNIYFFGYILYTDEGDGARRYTVICRRWNPLELTLGAFTPVNSEDHENAD